MGGTRYSTLPAHPPSPPRVHLPSHRPVLRLPLSGCYRGLNMVVGLRSVAQLSLGARFSRSRGMTEVYNLLRIDRITNHLVIPGNK